MRHVPLADRRDDFAVVAGTGRSQAAIMVLAPGATTGAPRDSEHPQADQWVYVIAGEGEAVGPRERHELKPGSLLLIAAGEGHEIRSTGREPLRTLNVYAPPAYDAQGEPLASG